VVDELPRLLLTADSAGMVRNLSVWNQRDVEGTAGVRHRNRTAHAGRTASGPLLVLSRSIGLAAFILISGCTSSVRGLMLVALVLTHFRQLLGRLDFDVPQ